MAALRSGEYEQEVGTLSRTYPGGRRTYCCEGVALERYGRDLGYEVQRTNTGTLRGRDVSIMRSSGSSLNAPTNVWRDMGMLVYEGSMLRLDVSSRDGKDFVFYSDMNDHGFTFPQIADLIQWQFLSGRETQGE